MTISALGDGENPLKLGTAIRDLKRGMTYYPELARVIGGVCPAVLFCCLSWKDKDLVWESDDGMHRKVRKTMEDLANETGLTEREMRGSRELLEKIGAIKCTYLRLEHICEFEVFLSRVDELCTDCEDRGASVKTSDAHLSKRQMPPDETSNGHLSKRQIDHCLEKKEENKRDTYDDYTSSPSPGEGFSTKPPMYDFGTFKNAYPQHRMRDNERAAREVWNSLADDDAGKLLIIEHVLKMSASKDWKKEGGKFVPNPQKYLNKRQWEHLRPFEVNHRAECEAIWQAYLEITETGKEFCAFTAARHAMLSERWDDAIEKADGHDPGNAMSAVRKAIQACADSHYGKKVPKRLTLEAIFETTEKFERWLEAAYLAGQN